MENLTILRMFASLPLFGLLLPDVATFIVGPFSRISLAHIYIEMFLLLFIVTCTWRISYIRKFDNTAGAGL